MRQRRAEGHQTVSQDAIVTELRRMPGLGDMSLDEVQGLADRGVCRACCPGEVIAFPHGQDLLGVVLQGSVRVSLSSSEGREVALGERRAGEMFELVETQRVHPAAGVRIVVAGQDGAQVCFLPVDDFLYLATKSQQGALYLVETLRDATRAREQVIGELAFCTVRTRVARVISQLAQESDGSLICETHQELAVRAGTGREEVSRALADFRRRKLVAPEGRGQLKVLKPERLAEDDISQP